LDIPQPMDKHAEGPRVRDHYSKMLTVVELLASPETTPEELEKVKELLNLGPEHQKQWEDVLKTIKEQPDFFRAFVKGHDVGKLQTVDVTAKKELGLTQFPEKSDAKAAPHAGDGRLAEYRKLYDAFKAENPDLTDDEACWKAFYAKYPGLSITYYKHADMAYGTEENKMEENKGIMAKLEKGLSDEQVKIFRVVVSEHMNPLQQFTKVDSKAVGKLMEKITQAGITDKKAALRMVQAVILLDGVFGTEKIKGEERVVEAGPFVNFLTSETAHENEAKAEAEKIRIKKAIDEAKIGSDFIMNVLGKKGKEVGQISEMIKAAVTGGGEIVLAGLSEDQLADLKKGIAKARETLGY